MTPLVSSALPSTRLAPAHHAAAALVGPLAIGAILAVRIGAVAPLVALPLVILGVTAVTTPALYIATAATGAAPPARAMASAVGQALGATGIAMLGLVAPLGFLIATTTTMDGGVALTSLAIGGATLVGLVALHGLLFAPVAAGASRPWLQEALFAVWAAVALIIAARLYIDHAVGAVS
jgi:hypothetical protein